MKKLLSAIGIQETTAVVVDDPRPNYYNRGGVECQHVIEAWGLNFSLGSVLKYVCRAGFKNDDIDDLRKARQYLTFEIDRREREQ